MLVIRRMDTCSRETLYAGSKLYNASVCTLKKRNESKKKTRKNKKNKENNKKRTPVAGVRSIHTGFFRSFHFASCLPCWRPDSASSFSSSSRRFLSGSKSGKCSKRRPRCRVAGKEGGVWQKEGSSETRTQRKEERPGSLWMVAAIH